MTVWWSKAVLIGGVIAALLLPLGALGSKFGIWHFGVGFMFLQGAAVLAVIMLVGGIVGWIVATKKGLGGDKPGLLLGCLVSALVLTFMGMQYRTATTVPPIHNITTNPSDPPQFDAVVALRGDSSNPLEYKAAELAPQQQAAYPSLQTLQIAAAPADALQRSQQALESMGLEIVAVSPDQGLVEATDTTFWFGFKDDVVVRVRPAAGGSAIDVRSVSRVGMSDLGANAARIGKFLKAMDAG
ncbi:MAG: DUF1499 domain-containing protein [Pseudomonadales bacterium]